MNLAELNGSNAKLNQCIYCHLNATIFNSVAEYNFFSDSFEARLFTHRPGTASLSHLIKANERPTSSLEETFNNLGLTVKDSVCRLLHLHAAAQGDFKSDMVQLKLMNTSI